VGDLHCKQESEGALRPLFAAASECADVLLLCGDLTDYGAAEEARVLAAEVGAAARIPVVAVLGNHDYEAGKVEQLKEILTAAGVRILDGGSCEIHGVGFAGVKGFAGGFGAHALGPWGEDAVKLFVHEAVEEALKLEAALGRLSVPQRIVLLHYAPIEGTIEGEPLAIYPFLGSSRLEEPLNRYTATAVFHGHAHLGTLEGRTSAGVPVFNVCLPLLRERRPDAPPFRVIEVEGASDA
jgi:Icc-related predicted phosphoesterase